MSTFGVAGDFQYAKKNPGQNGRKMQIQANFCPIKIEARKLYHYNINIEIHDFIREQSDKNVPQRNRILQQKRLVRESNYEVFERFVKQETTVFTSEPVFDGSKSIYSKTKLNITDQSTFQVKHKIAERKFPATFDITITTPKESHELDLSILNEKNVRKAEKEIQALDIIMQYDQKKNKVSVGSNFFPTHENIHEMRPNDRQNIRSDLGEMKEVRFGHYQSARLTEMGPQLNVDRAAVVFNKGGMLLDLIAQFLGELRAGPQRRGAPPPRAVEINSSLRINASELRHLNEELKGLSFQCEHISYKPKNVIYGLTDKSVADIMFDQKTRDSEQTVKVSVKTYFERTYSDFLERQGRNSLLGNLPCVQVGKLNAKFFPIESISIIHDQYSLKKLKPTQQSTMTTKCAQQSPDERFQESLKQISTLAESRSGRSDYLKLFNIKVEKRFAEVNGRVLESPRLVFGSNKTGVPREGQWRAEPYVIAPQQIGSDYMIVNYLKEQGNQIRSAPRREQVDEFIRLFRKISNDYGIKFGNPCEIIYNEDYKGRLDLDSAIAEYTSDHRTLKLIIFIIPKFDDLYHNIKYLTELKYGVVSQCVSQDKKMKFNDNMYVTNLMLKVNAKLGGTNTHLDAACKSGHLKKKTMIMGLDVTHPTRHDRLANSIAAVTATFDSKMVNYHARCVVQPSPRKEIVQLDQLMVEMLNNFKERNKFYPDMILMYRDGVSDGQFDEVVEKEVNLIKKAFSEISASYNPKLTFIVVQKRHHTRLLLVNQRDRLPKSKNVLPGTIVDYGITNNYYNEFYLCSHYGPLGTSRPARYIVLHDESGFSGDEIQQTTNLLSYLYPRCNKATSIATPVLYAHLAAKRARSYLHILDNNSGLTFGENELTPAEILDLNRKIEVNKKLKNILYFV